MGWPQTMVTTEIIATAKLATCKNSKSRAMKRKTKTTITLAITSAVPVTVRPLMPIIRTARRRSTTTARTYCLTALQVLMFAFALPPPLQPLLPDLLPQRRPFAIEALPITSKPIEGTAENIAWQAWLMLPPEQKQLEKSRKVTPKSIFSLPFRECPPGHQLFQSRCIPTVNINQSELLTQQLLGLIVGSDGGGVGAADGGNVYEFDYGDEELGEGEPMGLYVPPQRYSGSYEEHADSVAGSMAAGLGSSQQPPVRDGPLKFNLFEQKYPTSDYETDINSSAIEGSGGARPVAEAVPVNVSVVKSEGAATVYNASKFLDAPDKYLHQNISTSDGSNTTAPIGAANTGDTNNNNNTKGDGLSDLQAVGSNISAFTITGIDAIILPVEGSTTPRIAVSGSPGNLEPPYQSFFKDDSAIQLGAITNVEPNNNNNGGKEGVECVVACRKDDEAFARPIQTAEQQQRAIEQLLRADALLPIRSITLNPTDISAKDASYTTTIQSPVKEEHPRSVIQQKADAAVNTDGQETKFTTTIEPEGTTNFQIDETTVLEAIDGFTTASNGGALAGAILQQKQLETQQEARSQVESQLVLKKSKVEPVTELETISITTKTPVVTVEETTTTGDSVAIETKINTTETSGVPTTGRVAVEADEKAIEITKQPETQITPLRRAVILPTTITTTSKIILTTTPVVNRFHSASAAVTTIHTTTGVVEKPVTTAITKATPYARDSIAVAGATLSDNAVVRDVQRSGNSDLLNAAATDTNNNSNKNKTKSNKNMPTRSASSETNIEQEFRMINELVKGKRPLDALAAVGTISTFTLPTAEPSRPNDVEAIEGRRDAVLTTTPTINDSVAAVFTPSENDTPKMTSLSLNIVGRMPVTNQSIASTAALESGSAAEATTVENFKGIEISIENFAAGAATKIDHVTATTGGESETSTVSSTLWPRVMPMLGFGVTAAITTTQSATTMHERAESSTRDSSGENVGMNRSGSISSSHDNNNDISHNDKLDSHSHRNSKIIRINYFIQNDATINALDATAAAKATTAQLNSKMTIPTRYVPADDPAEAAASWWLPAAWRLSPSSNDDQHLLLRLWSAFPESQIKAKVSG